MSVATRLLTADEFFAMPGSRHQELVRGEVVERRLSGGVHGVVTARIGLILDHWAERALGGAVGVKSGFILARDPDTVRGPDVYYVRAERVAEDGVPEGFWRIAPDVVVEVVSPDDTAKEVRTKVREYLAAGTGAVWVVYPSTQEVIVHTPDGLARTFGAEATLETPDVLPGFSCPVSAIFSA